MASAEAPEAQTQPSASRGDRRVDLEWDHSVEVSDSLFGGYQVWRSTAPDPETFMLVRWFQRRYPITWTYKPRSEEPRRHFNDPDSVVALVKFQATPQGDSAISREYVGLRPFNGFPYYYAVTWLSECISERNDTISVHQPQPEIFPFMSGGEEHWGFEVEGDTLEVSLVPCRRIDPETNTVTDSTLVSVFQGTVESEEELRAYALEATRLESPIFPTSTPQENLRRVAVIPNPYVMRALWDEPGRRKIQFVNLPERATVRIFTVGGDLVRVIEHPAPGSSSGQGSVDWDLRNANGRLVDPEIYIYHVETPGGVADVVAKLVIVR
jgi:hypothetical protein